VQKELTSKIILAGLIAYPSKATLLLARKDVNETGWPVVT
jgi:hypothetical protein